MSLLHNEQYVRQFAIEKYAIPTVGQLMTTAARLGADTQGSTFAALSVMGFDAWINEADKEHELVAHICVKEHKGYLRGSEEDLLANHLYRCANLPVYN